MQRKKDQGTRMVIYLTDENALSVFAVTTPPGANKPAYGAVSAFFNEIINHWRNQRALKESKHDTSSAN